MVGESALPQNQNSSSNLSKKEITMFNHDSVLYGAHHADSNQFLMT